MEEKESVKWLDKLTNADIRATAEARDKGKLVKIEILYYSENKDVVRKRIIYHADTYEDFYYKCDEIED